MTEWAVPSVLERLVEADKRERKNWSVDWNALRFIVASDGTGIHIASCGSAETAERIVLMRNALPDVIAMAEALREITREDYIDAAETPFQFEQRLHRIAAKALHRIGGT